MKQPDLIDIIINLQQRVQTLEQNIEIRNLTFPSDGKLVVPVVTSDPASPSDGEIWYNSTSNTYKGRENGVTVTFTTA